MLRLIASFTSLLLAGTTLAQVPTVSIAVTDNTVAEAGNNTGRMRLSRTGATTAPLAVQTRVRGSATQGTDYTFSSGTIGAALTIPAGAAFLDIIIQPIDDTEFDEEGEDVRLEVRTSLAGEYLLGTPLLAEIEITDNDITPEPPTLSADFAGSGSESGPIPVSFRILREGTVNVALNVRYSLTGTAAAGSDYLAQTGSIAIPAGVSSAIVTVPVIDDAVIEAAETLVFTILPTDIATLPPPPAAYQLDLQRTASTTITSNDVPSVLQVTAIDDQATETGATPATFRIQRSSGLNTTALNVLYALTGSATAGSDYAALTGSVTLPSGVGFVDVSIPAIDDSEIESAETLVLTLLPTNITAQPQPLTAYNLGLTTTATATLVNNDYPPAPTVTITTPTNHIAEQGKPFHITFDAAIGDGHIVSYRVGQTVNSLSTSQTYTTDYPTPPAPGTVYTGSAHVTFLSTGNNHVSIFITSSNGGTASTTRTVYTIRPLPPPPPPLPPPPALPIINVYALDAEAIESTGAPNTAKFRVTHNFPTTSSVWFLGTVGGSASAVDFTLNVAPFNHTLGGWFEIPAGQSETIIEVTPVDDALVENPETVTFSLYNPPWPGFTEGGSSGFDLGAFGFYFGPNYSSAVSILDNESVPPHFNWVTIAATDPVASETLDNSDPARYTLTRTGATTHPLTVGYQLVTPPLTYPLTFPRIVMAGNGTDYQPLSGTVTFPIGASTADIVVNPIFDINVEPQETVQVQLLPSPLAHQIIGSYALGQQTTSTAHIISYTGNPPLATVSVEANVRIVRHRRIIRTSSGLRQLTSRVGSLMVSRSATNLSEPLTVHYRTSGSAINGVDYEFLPGTLTFAPGVRSVRLLLSSISSVTRSVPRVGVTITIIPPPSGELSYLISKNTASLSIKSDSYTPPPAAPQTAAAVLEATPPPDSPLIERLDDGGVVISQESLTTGKLFRVECSSDLANWQVLDIIQTEEGDAEYYDPDAAAMNRCFYRLVEVPAITTAP